MKKLIGLLILMLFLQKALAIVAQDTDIDNNDWVIVFYSTHFYTNRIDEPGLYWMTSDGRERTRIVGEEDLMDCCQETAIIQDVRLSPHGLSVVYTGDGRIFTYDLETKQILPIANGFVPVWSPDSQKIAFISLIDRDSDVLKYELRVIDISTREEQIVLQTQNSILEPAPDIAYVWDLAWSPDQTRLIASISPSPRVVRAGEVTDTADMGPILFSINLDGSDLQPILPDNIFGYRPLWLDEDNVYFICYTQQDKSPSTICEINLKTSEITTVGDFRDILPRSEWMYGEWLGDFSVLPDGSLLFTRSYMDVIGKAGDIYYFDIVTNTVTNLDEDGDSMNTYVQWFDRRTIEH
jgi:Tol biopolymer transport system component